MKVVTWLVRLLVFVLLFGFALKNTDPVTVRYYFGIAWQAPLVVVLLVMFVLGAGGGVLASLAYVLRQRRILARQRRELGLAPDPAPPLEPGL